MAGTAEVLLGVKQMPHIRYPVLVPNMKGLDTLLELVQQSPRTPPLTNEIAIFTAASESFCKANTNKSIAESLVTLAKVTEKALSAGVFQSSAPVPEGLLLMIQLRRLVGARLY